MQHEQTRIYHYTTRQPVTEIVREGIIRTSPPPERSLQPGERRAVWFSAHSTWEPTAYCVVDTRGNLSPASRVQLIEVGMFRIQVARSTAPIRWHAYARPLRRSFAKALARGGNPSDWFVSLAPVPRAKWEAVETFEDGAWVPASMGE